MKYLLIFTAFGFLTYMSWRWLLRYLFRLIQGMQGKTILTQSPKTQMMVCCKNCGLHIPERDAFYFAGQPYCSAAHAPITGTHNG